MNENINFSIFKWKVSLRFPNRDAFKRAVTKFAITQCRNLSFVVSNKNRQKRLGVKCLTDCPFRLYASWDSRRACFVVKSMDGEHICNRNMDANKQMKSTWLVEQVLEVFKARSHWLAKEIIETVRRAYMVIVKKALAYKVKYYAYKMLHRSMQEHYNKLGRYLQALKSTSPDTYMLLMTNPCVNLSTSFPKAVCLF